MNPFDIPMAGVSWVEIALALGASVVFLIYIYLRRLCRILHDLGTPVTYAGSVA